MDNEREDRYLIPAIKRMADIIGRVAHSSDGLNATDLIESVTIPPSTAYRILRSLTSVGFLELTEGKRFVLGGTLKSYGVQHQLSLDLVTVAAPFIDSLSEDLSETVKMSELCGMGVEVTYVSTQASAFRIAVDVGARFPLHAGAASKLLLAFLPEKIRDSYLDGELKSYTEKTISNRFDLERALSQVRNERCAFDMGEYVSGVFAVAFPIINATHNVVAALSVPYFGASEQSEEKRTQISGLARRTATRISRALGAGASDGEFPPDIRATTFSQA